MILPRRTFLFIFVIILNAASHDALEYSFTGLVNDPEGHPVPNARVALVSEAEKELVLRTTTDETGSFRLSPTDEVSWRLSVEKSGYRFYARTLEWPLNEVLVVLEPQRFSQTIEVIGAIPTLSSTSFDQKELVQRNVVDLAEGIAVSNGVESARRGAVNFDPSVRGLSGPQVTVSVDGTRTFAAGPLRMDSGMSHVNVDEVEEVQIVKGPFALSWGSGSLASIRLVTRQPRWAEHGAYSEGFLRLSGSDNTRRNRGSALVQGAFNALRYRLSVGYREGGDYEDGGGAEIPGDFTSMESSWSLGWRTNLGEFTYDGRYQAQDDIDYPGRILDATLFRTRGHRLAWNARELGGAEEWNATFYSNEKDHVMNNDSKPTALAMAGRMPPFGLDIGVVTTSDTLGGSANGLFGGETGFWKVGFDGYRLAQDATRTIARRDNGMEMFRDVIWPDVVLENLGLWVQWERRFSKNHLGATLRVDRFSSRAEAVSEFFQSNSMGELNRSDEEISAAVSVDTQWSDRVSTTFGLGRAVRYPTALELYSDRIPAVSFQIPAEFLGTPSLAPEAATELDVSLKWRLAQGSVSVDGFFRTIDDYITVEVDPTLVRRLPLSPPKVYRYRNSEGEFWGLELTILYEPTSWMTLKADSGYVEGEDKGFSEPAFGVAPWRSRISLRVQPSWMKSAWAELETIIVDRQDRVALARLEMATPGYTLWNLRAGKEISANLSLVGGVRNLEDEKYSHHLDALNPFSKERVSRPGREIHFAVEVRF